MKSSIVKQMLILISTLLIINCQALSIEQTITLQSNEQYTLHLDKFYSISANTISWPDGLSPSSVSLPYLLLSNQQTDSIVTKTLASYQDGPTSKYLLTYVIQPNSNISTSYDLVIYLYHLYLDSTNSILKRDLLSSTTLLTQVGKISSVSGGLYSSSAGFISYQIKDSNAGTFWFQNSAQNQLAFKNTEYNYFIPSFVTIQNPSSQISNVYIIFLDSSTQEITLLEYTQTNMNTLDKQQFQFYDTPQVIVDTATQLLAYDSGSNVITNAVINFDSLKLILNKVQLPFSQLFGILSPLSLQKYKDILIISLLNSDNQNSAIAKLQYQENVNSGTLTNIDYIELSIPIVSSPVFITEDILVFYASNQFNMVNIKQKSIVYIVTLDSTYSVDSYQFIGNQIAMLQSTTTTKGVQQYSVSAAQFQRPSALIQGTQTTTPFIFKVYPVLQEYEVEIKINIVISQTPEITIVEGNVVLSEDIYVSTLANKRFIPIENQVIGSNLQVKLSYQGTETSPYLTDLSFNTLVPLTAKVGMKTAYQSVFQLDGYFNSLLQTGAKTVSYSVLDQNSKGYIQFYSCPVSLESDIAFADNYGSFYLVSDLPKQQKTIYIPYISQGLKFFTYQTQTCQDTFWFASDPSNSVLFILCDSQIIQINYSQYQQNLSQLYSLQVLSSNPIQFNADSYTTIICIKGKLFISNQKNIAQYDYINNSMIGVPISIPQQYEDQSVILFSSTFLIAVINQKSNQIQQFSYNNFSKDTPLLPLRTFYIENQYTLSSATNLIAKRNQIEYLFAGTTTQNVYSIYRINDSFSQNQFYTTITLPSDTQNFPVISSEMACVISSQLTSCAIILQSASVGYVVNIDQTTFNEGFVFRTPFKITTADNNSVNYKFQVIRYAGTQFATINQTSYSFQSIRTSLQDSDFSSGQTFSFSEQQVTNACILGWTTDHQNVQIINQLSLNDSSNTYIVYQILYNIKVVVTNNSIAFGSLLTINDGNNYLGCIVLDDQGSITQTQGSNSFTMNVYALCPKTLYKMNITFTKNSSSSIATAKLNSNTPQQFNPQTYLENAQRIISINTQLWIFNSDTSLQYQIVTNSQTKILEIQPQIITTSSPISFNVIISQSLQLYFYRNGLIQVKNSNDSSNVVYQIENLKSLLAERFGYYIDEDDYISSIFQITDTSFRIQFANSFIYEIQFNYSQGSIGVQQGVLYYYNEYFNQLVGGIINAKYAILVGINPVANSFQILFYYNTPVQGQQLLFSSSASTSYNWKNLTLTYIEQTTQSTYTVYFSNGGQTVISIQDLVTIQFNQKKQAFGTTLVIITPINVFNPQNQVRFTIDQQTKTSSILLSFQIFSLLMALVVLFL